MPDFICEKVSHVNTREHVKLIVCETQTSEQHNKGDKPHVKNFYM